MFLPSANPENSFNLPNLDYFPEFTRIVIKHLNLLQTFFIQRTAITVQRNLENNRNLESHSQSFSNSPIALTSSPTPLPLAAAKTFF